MDTTTHALAGNLAPHLHSADIDELLQALDARDWQRLADLISTAQLLIGTASPSSLREFNDALDSLSEHLGVPFFSLPGLLRLYDEAEHLSKRYEGPLNAHPNAVHGTPITPVARLRELKGASFCVSFFRPDQLEAVIPLLAERSVLIADNGAFSAYRSGAQLDDAYWARYWVWATDLLNRCPQAVAVIPDVIGGSPQQNLDRILDQRFTIPAWEHRLMPVWHLNEPLDQLVAIYSAGYRYIAFGSCGDFDTVGTSAWDQRVDEAFGSLRAAADADGDLMPRVHMMRGLSQLQRGRHPFATADSTNLARNHSNRSQRGESISAFRSRVEAYRFPVLAGTFPGGMSNPDPRFPVPPSQMLMPLN